MNKVTTANLEEVINSCIGLRTLLTKIKKFGVDNVTPDTKETAAMETALGLMETGLKKRIERKNYKGSGEVLQTKNSAYVHRVRRSRELRIKKLIQKYFEILDYTPEHLHVMQTDKGEKL